MGIIKYNHSGGGDSTGSRALAKSHNPFFDDSEQYKVRIRQSAAKAIIDTYNPKTLDEFFRYIVEETKKPSHSRIAAFQSGILNETTSSAKYTDFLKPKDGSSYLKSERMVFRSGQADSKDGRADLSPNKVPAKTADIKIKALVNKKKKIKKV